MKAIRIHETGGLEVMKLEEVETPEPKEGQVLVKVAAAGINYADLMQRQGTYMTQTRTPTTLGFEFAGTVAKLGPGVENIPLGTRIVAFGEGGYAEYAIAAANSLIPIPESMDFVHAAAFPVQGITAYQLLHDSGRLKPGESVIVHAAAGGVGTLALQIARILGAGKIIGTASSPDKLKLVRELGADLALNYTQDDWSDQVNAATDGRGADVILEMAGGSITEQGLACLAPFGRMVVYGAASGQLAQFTGIQLMYKNQEVIGYWLTAQQRYPEKIAAAALALSQYLAQGQLKIIVGQTYPLAEVAAAHQAIAERKTTGKVVLLCE